MKLSFIGDVHGKIHSLMRSVLPKCTDSDLTIQLGDMGLGFPDVFLPNLHKSFGFIRGNHDAPDICRMHNNYIDDFGTFGPVFVIGGAFSIDWQYRVPGRSWWPNEELSIENLDMAYDAYVKAKPRIVATHEAPSQIGTALLSDGGFRPYKEGCIGSRTAVALNRMFAAHQPEYWYFGHYHRDWSFKKEGTLFRCLTELSVGHLEI